MHFFSKQNGGSRVKVFIWFIVLFLVVHVAYKLIPMYMDYTRMKDEMTVKASLAQVLKDHEIVKDLVSKAGELDLPLGSEDFILERDTERRRMRIQTAWDVEIAFFWGSYLHTFSFRPEVEESFMSLRM